MNRLKILHITNDYTGSTVYMNLVHELDELGVQQFVYAPIRGTNGIGKNKVQLKIKGSEILYRDILNYSTDRYFYPLKLKKLYRDIRKHIDFSQIDFIHAHTWYSDGGVAYLLSKKYNIPYIVTVRNTDLNVFQKRLKYLRPFGRKILQHSEMIILIAASYKEKVLELSSLKSIKSTIKPKLKVMPNGVDSFWIQNAVQNKKEHIENELQLLYVGQFIKRKEVLALQASVCVLNREYNKNIKLHLVGGGGADEQRILEQVNKNPHLFTYHGKVYDKNKLLAIYRSCNVLAMPSRAETFALVYVEAMLQGLPILYAKKEGVDGFYDEKIGEAVIAGDVEDITKKLILIYDNFDSYQLNIPLLKSNHDWRLIAKQYLKLYQV